MEPEEREFVVDSGASMLVVSKRDLNSTEMGTMRTSRSPDDGDDGQRRGANQDEEATVYVKELDLFVTVILREETPAFLSFSCQKPHLIRNGKKIHCNKSNNVPFMVPGLSTSSLTTPTHTCSTSSSQDSVFGR